MKRPLLLEAKQHKSLVEVHWSNVVFIGTVFALTVAMLPTEPVNSSEPSAIATPPRLAGAQSFMVDDDYPAEALKHRQEGATKVALQISKKGKVIGCRVVESSGSQSLDEASCTTFSKLKFKPARDVAGFSIESEFIRKINWTLPRRPAPPR